MKARFPVWLPGLLFILATGPLLAQNQTRNKSGNDTQKVLKNTTIQIKAESYRGILQWQWSPDTLNWENFADQTRDILVQTIKTDIYFRVGVKENTCDWLYSDFIKYIPIEKATVTTYPVTDIGINQATGSGEIMNTGNDTILMAGICYGLAPDPDTTGPHVRTEVRSGIFEITLTDLLPNTNYHVRAFATNDAGIGYGLQTTFTTQVGSAVVLADTITMITDSSALARATFNLPGGGSILDAGFCWGTRANPDLTGSFMPVVPDLTSLSGILTGLDPNIIYFVRAYVTNEAGTTYSSQMTFRTLHRRPAVETIDVTGITESTALYTGNVSNPGGGTITLRGFCWSTLPLPDITDTKMNYGSGLGTYTGQAANLLNNTIYYVRAYAVNEAGVGYGQELEFSTLPALPVLTTKAATALTDSSAVSGGDILYSGGATITAKGVCWSTDSLPVRTGNHATTSINSDSYLVTITDLLPGRLYYVRAYATNPIGTGYGQQRTFFTLPRLPEVTTDTVKTVTFKQAVVGGRITSTNNGTISARGICWSRQVNPDLSDSVFLISGTDSLFSGVLTGLTHQVTYYAKAFCSNEAGTGYGNQVTFTTLSALPLTKTNTIHSITSDTARVDGVILDNGGSVILEKGICWGPDPYPDIKGNHTRDGGGSAPFSGLLTDLIANRQYYVRSYATTLAGTSYGNAKSFKTPDDGTYADVPVLSAALRSSFKGWKGIFPERGSTGQGYSGVTYDWERNQVLIVGNNALHIWVIQAPGYGIWSDNNPSAGFIRTIQLEGFYDTEALNYLGNSWLMVQEEGTRLLYFFQINDITTKITKSNAAVVVDPTPLIATTDAKAASNQLEGIAFDFYNRKVYALVEIGPLNYPRIFMWNWDDVNKKVVSTSKTEITHRFQGLSTDFSAASDLFYSPLLKRLYIVDGSSNKLGEYDCSDPASITFGRKLALIQEPLTNGTTGTDLGDLEGFGISADGLYSYMCFEDQSFGYGIAPLVRNLPDNNLPPALYPFPGTPGTWSSDDFPALNDPTVYLSKYKGSTDLIDTTKLEFQWNQLRGAGDTILTNLSDLAFDEVNDRLCLVTRTHPTNNQRSFLNFFDLDGNPAGRHTLNSAYAVKPDGSMLPGVNRSIINGVVIRSHTNLSFSWLSGLDGSVLSATLDGLSGPQIVGNQVTDARVSLAGSGQGFGTSTSNTYESLAIDYTHRNCIWTLKQTSFSLEEYRGGVAHRSINFGGFTVPGAGKTVGELMTHITGLYYDDLSDHLFIGGYNSSSGISYIIEMKMLDKTIMGYLRLKLTHTMEGFSFNENLSRLAVLYKNAGQPIQVFKK